MIKKISNILVLMSLMHLVVSCSQKSGGGDGSKPQYNDPLVLQLSFQPDSKEGFKRVNTDGSLVDVTSDDAAMAGSVSDDLLPNHLALQYPDNLNPSDPAESKILDQSYALMKLTAHPARAVVDKMQVGQSINDVYMSWSESSGLYSRETQYQVLSKKTDSVDLELKQKVTLGKLSLLIDNVRETQSCKASNFFLNCSYTSSGENLEAAMKSVIGEGNWDRVRSELSSSYCNIVHSYEVNRVYQTGVATLASGQKTRALLVSSDYVGDLYCVAGKGAEGQRVGTGVRKWTRVYSLEVMPVLTTNELGRLDVTYDENNKPVEASLEETLSLGM